MPGRDKDEIGRLFARLTGQLEDACEVAVAGQNRRSSLGARARLAAKLRRRLTLIGSTLDVTVAAIDNAKSGATP